MPIASNSPVLVLSDVHLNYGRSTRAAAALARLLRHFATTEVILAGDVFDLSADPPRRDPATSLIELLQHHRDVFDAFRAHLSSGGKLTLIAGNHDAEVADERVRRALLDALGLQHGAELQTQPWFVRRGRIHIEHGHLYDPDNAPVHPLAPWSYATEPLGIALTRRFLAPSGALDFAHAHETTPLGGLIQAFQAFGTRAPLIVAHYFATATRLCIEAGRQSGLAVERELGENALEAFAESTGVPKAVLAELASARQTPTHHRFMNTFMRLYFDRVFATLSFAFAASALLTRRSPLGAAIAAASSAYLASSVKKGTNRYGGVIEQRLREAAHNIALKTDAELVIFGHTHREESAPFYLNSGSFGFAQSLGRPYILIEHGREPERRYLTA